MSKGTEKLVGTLFLDLTRLKEDVKTTNNLLKSIGAGVNINMSDVVTKQVRAQLKLFEKEIQRMTQSSQKGGKKIKGISDEVATGIEKVVKQTETMDSQTGAILRRTTEGYDALGRKVREVASAAGGYSSTVLLDQKGDQAKAQKKANDLYKEQAQLLEKLYSTKAKAVTSSDPKEVENLRKQIDYLERVIGQNKNRISNTDPEIAKQAKLNQLVQEEQKLREKLNSVYEKSFMQDESAQQRVAKDTLSKQTTGYSELAKAKKAGDSESANYWKNRIESAKAEVDSINKIVSALPRESSVRKEILDIVEKTKAVERDFFAQEKKDKQKISSDADNKMLKDAQEALRQQKEAYRGYSKAQKDHNTENMRYYEEQASKAKQQIQDIEKSTAALDANSKVRARILRIVGEMKVAERVDQDNKQKAITAEDTKYLERAKVIATQLTSAYAELEKAKRNSNKDGETFQSAEITRQKRELEGIEKTTSALEKNGSVRLGVLAAVEKMKALEAGNIANEEEARIEEINAKIRERQDLYRQFYTAKTNLLTVEKGSNAAEVNTNLKNDAFEQLQVSVKAFNIQKESLAQKIQLGTATEAEKNAYDEILRTSSQIYQLRQSYQSKRDSLKVQDELKELTKVQATVTELTTAMNNYNAAKRAGNQEGQTQYANQITAISSELAGIKETVGSLKIEEKTRERILALIQDAEMKQKNFSGAVEESNKRTQEVERNMDRIAQRVTSFVGTMLIMRGLRTLWRNAKEYAKEYYDQMNEIRIVSQMTEEEAEKLGDSYRRMAKDMSVSSTEIATAANEFWRQGLSADEVEDRLVSTTKYAKISGLEFSQAAEIVTAATNAMEIGAENAVDVFAYLGDASASGSDEIGIAMQKASASAKEFGLSFEWLGSYIATMSEKTRQAPEVIGTSLNSIMARMHSIKSKGFNEEDETKLNDVAKALATINVKLLDVDGNWRAMSDIFMDIGSQWGVLDAKQKAYISTTLAGVRQQNYFLTLMNDLSKATEGESRAVELYTGAMDAAGVSAQKYGIWQESVTAAQNDFKVSLEELYALLDADWMKGFYHGMAGFISMMAKGIDSTNGMSVAIPALTAAFGALIIAIKKGMLSMAALGTAFAAHPIMQTVMAVGALVTAFSTLAGAAAQAGVDIEESMSKVKSSLDKIKNIQREYLDDSKEIKDLRDRYVELSSKTALTAEEQEELRNVVESIKTLCPELASAIDGTTGTFNDQIKVVEEQNKNLRETRDLYLAQAQIEAKKQFSELGKQRQALSDKESILKDIQQYEEWGAKKGYDRDRLKSEETAREYVKSEAGKDNFSLGHFYEKGTFENWYKDYDSANQETIIEGTKNKIKQEYRDLLTSFSDTSFLDGILKEAADKELSDVNKEINSDQFWEGTEEEITDKLKAHADRNKGVVDRYTEAETNIKNNQDAFAGYEKIKKMKRDLESGASTDIEGFKTAVSTWNAAFGKDFEIELSDSVKVFEQVGSAAQGASEKIDKAATAVERYKEVSETQAEVSKAGEEGFKSQLEEIRNSNDPRQSLLDLSKNSPELYNAMYKEYGDALGQILSNDLVGEGATNALSALIDGTVENVANKYQELSNQIEGMTKEGTDDISQNISLLLDSLQLGDENGLGSEVFFAQFGKLSEEMQEKLIALMPWIAEFAEGVMAVSEAENNLLSMQEGTTENFSKFFTDIASSEGDELDKTIQLLEKMKSVGEIDGGVESFKAAWSGLDKDVQNSVRKILDENDDLIDSITDGGENAEEAIEKIGDMINHLKLKKLEDAEKVLEGTSDAVKLAGKEHKKFSTAFSTMTKKAEDLTKAQQALNYINSEGEKPAEELEKAYDDLSSYTGMTADVLRNNLGVAEEALAQDTDVLTGTIVQLAEWQINVGGLSFDPSTWSNGFITIGNDASAAQSAIAKLVNALLQVSGKRIGLGENNEITVSGGAGSGKYLTTVKPSAGFGRGRGRGGHGGGGGGHGSKDENSARDQMSEVEKMLDIMAQIQDIQDHRREMNELAKSYHESRGEIQGVITYLEREKKLLTENSSTLQENISDIEEQIEKKKIEVSTLDKSTEEYEQAASDLKALQERHMEYSKQLKENKNDVEELEQAIKEQNDIIRDMEIELRETILQAILDREELNERMLQGTISVENEILDLITKRYEKERDQILETAEAKKNALEEEKRLLDEQLNKRKELAAEEDKALKLAQLEEKLNRITADPTRRKEELALRKEIAELRDEMAWDLAEKEVDAQKESIDEQITNIEDYMEYVKNYYDDLFEHPMKLIEEMKEVMKKSDEEILEWLKTNSEEFANATEATQQDMVNGWNDMLMDMHGSLELHWEEVESIISQGDQAIIDFLKQNSAEYREAGTLQAEAFVDQWKKQLEDLRKAHKQIADEIRDYDYSIIHPGNGGSGGSHSGGGGGGGGGGSGGFSGAGIIGGVIGAKPPEPAYYVYRKNNKLYTKTPNLDEAMRQGAMIKGYVTEGEKGPVMRRFASGGLAKFTGPAWVDGTTSRPERILSPYQTELFEDMISTLHSINQIKAPLMPFGVGQNVSQASSPVTFGDLVVNVEKLEDDADYEEIVNKLFSMMLEKMNRGSAVGGIRLNK